MQAGGAADHQGVARVQAGSSGASRGCFWACGVVAALGALALLFAGAALFWSDHSAKAAYNKAPGRNEALIARELPLGSSREQVIAFLARHQIRYTGDYDSIKEITGLQEFDPLVGACRVELAFGFDQNWALTTHAVRVQPCTYPWSSVI